MFLARRGWTCRVATVGLVKEARGRGYGCYLLETAITEATTRGDRSMVLEIFTENEPAACTSAWGSGTASTWRVSTAYPRRSLTPRRLLN